MKIAIITTGVLPIPAAKGGAVENLVENLLNENDAKGKFNITVFSIFDENAVNISKKYINTNFIYIKTTKIAKAFDNILFFIMKNILRKQNAQSYRYIFQRLSFLNKVSKYLSLYDYDKLLLENHETEYLALKWRKNYIKYEGKYYYHCHNSFKSFYGCKNIILSTKKFICVSDYIANSVCNFTNVPKNNTIVLRNCINDKVFNKKLSIKEKKLLFNKLGIDEKDFVILFTGRMIKEKGIKELLMAVEKLNINNLKVIIIGAPVFNLNVVTKYQEEVESIINSIKKNVIFTGYINYSEIYKYYNLADIAVLPSTWDDPAPLTIIESLTVGLPIISTVSGGIPEYAVNDSAILLDRDDKLVDNIAQSIKKLYESKERRKKMSINCKNASKDLTLENYYFNFSRIMKEGDSNE